MSFVTQASSNSTRDGIALRTNDDRLDLYPDRHGRTVHKTTSSPSLQRLEQDDPYTTLATGADCDRRRPEEGDHPRMATMSSSLISKTVTPYLREHIPQIYAPVSKADNEDTNESRDPNSKFCYRHRPDSLCRRGADESKMVSIQRVSSISLIMPSFGCICIGIQTQSVGGESQANSFLTRNSISCLLLTSRPSHTSGLCLARHLRNTESLYLRVFYKQHASLNYQSSAARLASS